MRDETRQRILRRRAAFIAAAMSTAGGCGPCNPLVCLEPPPAPNRDGGADTGAFDGSVDAFDEVSDTAEAFDVSDASDTADAREAGKLAAPKPKPFVRPCLSAPFKACLTEL